jgi:hypothetical protein
MPRVPSAVPGLLLLAMLHPAAVAAQRGDVPAADRARGAERVVVGRVASVTPLWRVNEYGDRLIVSVVHVSVDETLKGASDRTVDVEVEGGTVGSVTLRVSDLDTFVPGDRAVFYLDRTRGGRLVPHRRGLGFQKIDRQNRVRGTGVSLDDVRREVRRAGGGR